MQKHIKKCIFDALLLPLYRMSICQKVINLSSSSAMIGQVGNRTVYIQDGKYIRSACVIARYSDEVMMVIEDKVLNFPGGCVERYDTCSRDTAFREFCEETFDFRRHPSDTWLAPEWLAIKHLPRYIPDDEPDDPDEVEKEEDSEYREYFQKAVNSSLLASNIRDLINKTTHQWSNGETLAGVYFIIDLNKSMYTELKRHNNVVFVKLNHLRRLFMSGNHTYIHNGIAYDVRTRESAVIRYLTRSKSKPSRYVYRICGAKSMRA